MYIIEIPYEWLESVFGTYIADNFNTICLCLCIGGLIAITSWGTNRTQRYNKSDWLEDAQKRQQTRFEYLYGTPQKANPEEKKSKINTNKGFNGKQQWYPTGWTFNEETQLWEPPDYINDEARTKWEWDEEKQIWIDTKKRQRMERYKKFREGREPTFEEWKAAHKHPEE